jgi:hypothetical protein
MPQTAILSSAGPLCNSVDDVKRYLSALWADSFFSLNLHLPPIKFREDAYKKTLQSKLKIGYLCYNTTDGKTFYGLENLPVSKATTRAVEMTI